jgi:hypothetical protein
MIGARSGCSLELLFVSVDLPLMDISVDVAYLYDLWVYDTELEHCLEEGICELGLLSEELARLVRLREDEGLRISSGSSVISSQVTTKSSSSVLRNHLRLRVAHGGIKSEGCGRRKTGQMNATHLHTSHDILQLARIDTSQRLCDLIQRIFSPR